MFTLGCLVEAPVESPCPPQSSTNVHRSEAMAGILEAHELPQVCFGPFRPSVIVETGQIWMDQALPVREGAARLAHLLEHDAAPPIVPGEGCLSGAIEAEVQALSTELAWRQKLAVDYPVWTLDFEAQWRESPDDELIRAYLYQHPEGGGGIAPVLKDYEARCDDH